MQILLVQPIDKKKCKVRLEDGEDFVLYKKEIKSYDLLEGEELSEEKYAQILSETLIPRAKRRALHLLEQMDRTEAQLRKKLFDSGYPTEAIEQALSYVYSYHYIDDERYVRTYIRSYQETHSRMRIEQDLLGKGIAKDMIASCMEEEYQTSEEEQIRAILAKKGYDAASAAPKERAKMARHLASKGYRMGDIYHALDVVDDY